MTDQGLIVRQFWIKRVRDAFKKRNVVWLHGLRRTGKTTLCRSLPNINYFNCDLPKVGRSLEDPEAFFREQPIGKIIVLDEIHQLPNPSLVLKIAADEFRRHKVIATGSSTLTARKKITDTLTGRKTSIHLLPALYSELSEFGVSIKERMFWGGLPQSLKEKSADFFLEWMDSFYSRDIQEEFNIEKRQPFLKVLEYLLVGSGGLFEVTRLAQVAGVSRPTVTRYLDALEQTKAITIVRPYSRSADREIIAQPKIYGFDTGFICHARGIDNLRPEDEGLLLENLVLENLQACLPGHKINYWRTKQKQELDFVLPGPGGSADVIEVKRSITAFDPSNLKAFRLKYPKGRNALLTLDATGRARTISYGKFKVESLNLSELEAWMDAAAIAKHGEF